MESSKYEKPKSDEHQLAKMRNKRTHIPSLDGLRALAIVLVLLRHAVILYSRRLDEKQAIVFLDTHWNTFFINGWVGVDLFFVLSGFLIARPFLQTKRRIPFKPYILKRIFRIFPAYFFVLIAIVIGAIPYYSYDTTDLWAKLIIHALFLQDYGVTDINVVMWSLGVEEKFYLVLPAAFYWLRKRKKGHYQLLFLFIPILIAPIFRYLTYIGLNNPTDYAVFFKWIRAPFHVCLEPLTLGIIIAFCEYYKWKPLPAKTTFAVSFMLLIGLLFSHPFLQTITLYDAVFQPILIAFIMAGLVYGAVFGASYWIFTNNLGRFIAKISYSLYLIHWPLFPLSFFIASSINTTYKVSPDLTFLVFTLIFSAISIVAAAIQYRYIEKPFLDLKKKRFK